MSPNQSENELEVVHELGQGGMARLVLARRASGELRVVKFLREDRRGNEVIVRRFEREALVGSRLVHPHIARVFGALSLHGQPCIEMELIDGINLRDLIRLCRQNLRALPVGLSVGIIRAILEALDYAHALRDERGEPMGIVHRDLSPANVMISRSGEIKVIDFGVARSRVDDFKTAPNVKIGTLLYMSPEQARCEQPDHRSDLYTVGALLFELLSRTPLVPPQAIASALAAICYEPAPVLDERYGVGPALSEVVSRALRKHPDTRFQNARAFIDALDSVDVDRPPSLEGALGSFVRSLAPDDDPVFDRTRAMNELETEEEIAPEALVALSQMITKPAHPAGQVLVRGEPSGKGAKHIVRRGAMIAVPLALAAGIALRWPQRQREVEVTPVATDVPQVVAQPQIRPQPVLAEPPLSAPRISAPPASAKKEKVPTAPELETKSPIEKRTLEPLSRKLLVVTSEKDLFDLHDQIETAGANVGDESTKRAVHRALLEFRQGGGKNALRRAIDVLEPDPDSIEAE